MLLKSIITADSTTAMKMEPGGARREKWIASGAASNTVTTQVNGSAQR